MPLPTCTKGYIIYNYQAFIFYFKILPFNWKVKISSGLFLPDAPNFIYRITSRTKTGMMPVISLLVKIEC